MTSKLVQIFKKPDFCHETNFDNKKVKENKDNVSYIKNCVSVYYLDENTCLKPLNSVFFLNK